MLRRIIILKHHYTALQLQGEVGRCVVLKS